MCLSYVPVEKLVSFLSGFFILLDDLDYFVLVHLLAVRADVKIALSSNVLKAVIYCPFSYLV